MSDLPEVTLVTRTLQGADFVEALSVADGPRLEVPLGSRLAVEYQSGETPPVVHVELLASRVRFVDREALPADEVAEHHEAMRIAAEQERIDVLRASRANRSRWKNARRDFLAVRAERDELRATLARLRTAAEDLLAADEELTANADAMADEAFIERFYRAKTALRRAALDATTAPEPARTPLWEGTGDELVSALSPKPGTDEHLATVALMAALVDAMPDRVQVYARSVVTDPETTEAER